MTRKISTPERVPARQRLLAAAELLFYEEGFNTVGIDRVIEVAGVAKASLYDCFGSKEALVHAYLAQRRDARRLRITQDMARHTTARDRLLGVFDTLGALISEPSYRGCAFVKAGADARPGSSVKAVCEDARHWMLELFGTLATEAGVPTPQEFGAQMMMLYDGASISAQMDHNPQAAATARTVAMALLDAATAPRTATGRAGDPCERGDLSACG